MDWGCLPGGSCQRDFRPASRLCGEEQGGWLGRSARERQNESRRIEEKGERGKKKKKVDPKSPDLFLQIVKSSLKKFTWSYPDTWSQKRDLNPHFSIPIYYSSITTSCGLEIITSENANEMQPGFLGSSLFLIYIKTYTKLNNLWKAKSFLWQKGKPERYEAREDLDGLLLSLKIEGLHEKYWGQP